MKINVIGAGPAGLYFSILMKKLDPAHQITVIERDGPNDTFGWGIVFSEETFKFLEESDVPTYREITASCQTWDDVVVGHQNERVRVAGNHFSGIARLAFLQILHKRCRELGVELRFHTNITSAEAIAELAEADLLVGGDGANSLVRQTYSGFFCPSLDLRHNKFIWLGTNQLFDGLYMIFRQAEAGLFIAHAYRFNPTTSTFIVECPLETWQRAGIATMSDEGTCTYLAEVFRDDLGGKPLLSNNFVKWLNFPLVKNKSWSHGNIVLLGDALHTAHFSIGSGTKLALEDAISLAACFAENRTVGASLAAFEQVRKPVVEKFQIAALHSLTWLENVEEHLPLEPVAFAYRLMTRSRRVSYKRIQRGDPDFIARYDVWRSKRPSAGPIPSEYLDIFRKPAFAHLATLMPDGTPHVTSVWVDYDGKHVLVNSAKGRLKDRNIEKRRDVAIEIPDPDNPNRYLAVRGPVVEITEHGADAHLNALAKRYLNRDEYPASMRLPGEVRRIYKILPKKVTIWDPFGT